MPNESIIGVDIGGTKTAVSIWSRARGLRRLAKFPTGSPRETLAEVAAVIQKIRPAGVKMIGIACGSPLDAQKGLILLPPHLPAWKRVRVCERLSEATGLPSFLMNDANANALAEWKFGAGRGARSLVYLTAGTGMGSGIILDGRLVEGACDNAGEIGHVRLDRSGPVGYGKAGSVEGFTAGETIPSLVLFLPPDLRPARPAAWHKAHPALIDVAQAAGRGDRVARAVLAEAGRRLGQTLAILVDILNPEMIVIGSLYVRCRRWIEGPMRQALKSECLPASRRACRIVPAGLGEEVGDYGAVCVALHRASEARPIIGRNLFRPSARRA